jgi:hypothetical protein
MAPKKKADADTTTTDTAQKVLIAPKSPDEWMSMIRRAETEYRCIHVVIQLRERLLAGKPAKLDAAEAMLKARGLEDQIKAIPIDDPNARADAAQSVATDEGKCEFFRRADKPGLWMPTNQIKAMLKENYSVLGFRNEIRGSRQDMAEGLFVVSDVDHTDRSEYNWVFLGDATLLDDESTGGVYTAVSHSTGPSGPVSAIKRHEYLVRPRIQFDILIAKRLYAKRKPGETLPDEALARTLAHAQIHGLGACRSQGYGTFDIVAMEERSVKEFDPGAVTGVAPQAA